MSIKEIIANAISGNAGEFESAFEQVMSAKMEAAIGAKYKSMFKEEKEEDMEDEDGEEEDDSEEDDMEDGEDEEELDEKKKSKK